MIPNFVQHYLLTKCLRRVIVYTELRKIKQQKGLNMRTYQVVVNGVVFFERNNKAEAMDLAWNRDLLNAVARSYGVGGKISTVAIEEK